MANVLVLGGTRFIGRATVEEFRSNGDHVTTFTRGTRPDPFVDDPGVSHVIGDRTEESAIQSLAAELSPDIVIDCIAYHPDEVAVATDAFADAEAYVYVSSSGVYPDNSNPKREDETPLRECTPDQAVNDDQSTYANRKAEGDREVVLAAERGVRALSVRPCLVYGPHDYTERSDYWIDRVRRFDRVVVPGDGQHLFHRVFVRDLARAFRVVAERGRAGEAYNAADRHLDTLDAFLDSITRELGREDEVEFVHALPRDLATGDLSVDDFVCYRDYTHVLSTAKLSELGWESTPLQEAVAETVETHLATDIGPGKHDLSRDAERAVIDAVDRRA